MVIPSLSVPPHPYHNTSDAYQWKTPSRLAVGWPVAPVGATAVRWNDAEWLNASRGV